ncbi:hypothetical protein RRG08_045958 [Elysia crispata]|uniref:Uncharacterized protein n=1 Tax=Elysia crispata TaxID=231223 RepID=A0AAE1ARI3_9GAST|nr:hypothetical protein RRG08_045958 [Elysia crispata]
MKIQLSKKPVIFLELLLLFYYVALRVVTATTIKSACGYEPVPNNPAALQICSALGRCKQALCSPGKVFDKAKCGCVYPSISPRSKSTPPLVNLNSKTDNGMSISSPDLRQNVFSPYNGLLPQSVWNAPSHFPLQSNSKLQRLSYYGHPERNVLYSPTQDMYPFTDETHHQQSQHYLHSNYWLQPPLHRSPYDKYHGSLQNMVSSHPDVPVYQQTSKPHFPSSVPSYRKSVTLKPRSQISNRHFPPAAPSYYKTVKTKPSLFFSEMATGLSNNQPIRPLGSDPSGLDHNLELSSPAVHGVDSQRTPKYISAHAPGAGNGLSELKAALSALSLSLLRLTSLSSSQQLPASSAIFLKTQSPFDKNAMRHERRITSPPLSTMLKPSPLQSLSVISQSQASPFLSLPSSSSPLASFSPLPLPLPPTPPLSTSLSSSRLLSLTPAESSSSSSWTPLFPSPTTTSPSSKSFSNQDSTRSDKTGISNERDDSRLAQPNVTNFKSTKTPSQITSIVSTTSWPQNWHLSSTSETPDLYSYPKTIHTTRAEALSKLRQPEKRKVVKRHKSKAFSKSSFSTIALSTVPSQSGNESNERRSNQSSNFVDIKLSDAKSYYADNKNIDTTNRELTIVNTPKTHEMMNTNKKISETNFATLTEGSKTTEKIPSTGLNKNHRLEPIISPAASIFPLNVQEDIEKTTRPVDSSIFNATGSNNKAADKETGIPRFLAKMTPSLAAYVERLTPPTTTLRTFALPATTPTYTTTDSPATTPTYTTIDPPATTPTYTTIDPPATTPTYTTIDPPATTPTYTTIDPPTTTPTYTTIDPPTTTPTYTTIDPPATTPTYTTIDPPTTTPTYTTIDPPATTPTYTTIDPPANTPTYTTIDPPANTPTYTTIDPPTTTPTYTTKDPPANTPTYTTIDPPTTTPTYTTIDPPATTPTYTTKDPPANTPTYTTIDPPATTPTYTTIDPPATTPTYTTKDPPATTPTYTTIDPPANTPTYTTKDPPANTPTYTTIDPPTTTPTYTTIDPPTTTPTYTTIDPPANTPTYTTKDPPANTPTYTTIDPPTTTLTYTTIKPLAATTTYTTKTLSATTSNKSRKITPRANISIITRPTATSAPPTSKWTISFGSTIFSQTHLPHVNVTKTKHTSSITDPTFETANSSMRDAQFTTSTTAYTSILKSLKPFPTMPGKTGKRWEKDVETNLPHTAAATMKAIPIAITSATATYTYTEPPVISTNALSVKQPTETLALLNATVSQANTTTSTASLSSAKTTTVSTLVILTTVTPTVATNVDETVTNFTSAENKSFLVTKSMTASSGNTELIETSNETTIAFLEKTTLKATSSKGSVALPETTILMATSSEARVVLPETTTLMAKSSEAGVALPETTPLMSTSSETRLDLPETTTLMITSSEARVVLPETTPLMSTTSDAKVALPETTPLMATSSETRVALPETTPLMATPSEVRVDLPETTTLMTTSSEVRVDLPETATLVEKLIETMVSIHETTSVAARSNEKMAIFPERFAVTATSTKPTLAHSQTSGAIPTTSKARKTQSQTSSEPRDDDLDMPSPPLPRVDFPCGSEVNISGVSADGSVLGEADLGRVYVGQKGVKRANDKFMRFNGRGEMWIPMYAGSRFTSGLSITIFFKEDLRIEERQCLLSNCDLDSSPSFYIILDPIRRVVKFKVVIVTMSAPYPMEDSLEISVPYKPGVMKTAELQCDGSSLIGRVDKLRTKISLASSDTFHELASKPKPFYVGGSCKQEKADNFYGLISQILVYRCVPPT